MRQLVDEVLAERRLRDNRRRRLTAGIVAFTGHTLLAVLVAIAPVFAARRQTEVRDYMRVMIVPAKALGEAAAPDKPKPTPPARVAKREEPVPERKPAETKPEPQPTAVVESPSRQSRAEVPATAPAGAAPEVESSRRRGGPDGSTFGTSAFGSSEASFDDPNFMYGYYVQQMLALIGSHWVRPRANSGTEMIIHFNISRKGQLTEIEVVKESGNRSFDLAGFRAVALASPLPPLPQSYRSDSLGVNLVIR